MRINGKIQRVVVSAGLAWFVIVASGAAMTIHLSCCDGHEEHDGEHCNLCQQLHVVNKHCMFEVNICVVDFLHSCDDITYRVCINKSISSDSPAEARAPPHIIS